MAKVTVDYILGQALLHSHALSDIIGSAAGNNTNIQFNNAGALDGSNNLTWDGSKVFVGGDIDFSANEATFERAITAQVPTAANTEGTHVSIYGSQGNGIANGGGAELVGADGGAGGGDGGRILLAAGFGTVNGDGGDLEFAVGYGSGVGINGKYTFNETENTGGTWSFVGDMQGTAQTLTVPKNTGTIALTSDIPAVITDHSALSNLTYASAGHTGFEPTVTKGNLTETTSSVLTIGSGTGAVIGTGTTIQVTKADASNSGYLDKTDFSTFNSKEPALTKGNLTESTSSVLTIGSGTGAVIGSGTTIQVKKSSATQDGYLAQGDFSTFNSKEPALTKGNLTELTSGVLTIGSGTGAVIGSGTTLTVTKADVSHDGYLSQGDWGTFNGKEAAGIDLRLDQTSPQSVINGRATFAQGLLLGLTPTVGVFAEGKLYYDATYKTASLNIDTDVNLQIGQETLIRAINAGGTTINNGEAVYLSGASGVFPTVLKAQANSDTTSYVAGVATQNILAGQEGFITARGIVHDLNTNSWTAGDNLYLSDTVAGGLQNTVPAAPGIEARVGRVVVKDASVGSIYVNPTGLRRLTDLSDVTITTPAVDQTLKYNGSEWVNGAPATSSASAGIEFFNATPIITATGANNDVQIATLSKTPVTTAEQTVTISMASNTVTGSAWLYDTALGRTSIDAGVWDFDTYAAVNSVAAGRVTTITRQIYSVLPTSGGVTVTTTGTLTSRTATASGGTPFAVTKIDASATNTTASYLQTPQGLYQITARTSDTVVTIATPTTYTNEAGVTFNVWKKLFGSTSPTITSTGTSYSLFAHTSTQSAFTITTAHKLGGITFGTSNNTTTVTLTYNGTTHNTHFQTPLITLHGNLAGLQGGTGSVPTEEYYHLTSAEHTVAQNTSGTNTGDVTLASPNHGLGLTNQVINLGTPSSVTSTSTNSVTTTTHTHALADYIPFAWTEVTGTSQALAINNGYILNNAALVTATLPSTAAVGSRIRIVGKGAGGWKVAQNASQFINIGSSVTTTGVTGHIDSTVAYDCMELLCTTANNGWVVISSMGNLTIV